MRIICLILAALGLTTGCEPTNTPPTTTLPAVEARHVVWGDSLSWQATNYGPGEYRKVEGREWNVYPGQGIGGVGLRIIGDLHTAPKPAVMTLALGTNDAGTWDGRDGWTQQDKDAWTNVLAHKGQTKIVIVLPWIKAGTVATSQDVANVEAARAWLSSRPGVQIVDWREYVAQGVLDQGGIHVTAGYEGVRYQATVAGDPL